MCHRLHGSKPAADDVLELYLEGGIPLHAWRAQTLPSEQQLDACLSNLVIGLFNLHQRGILHGDLKPGNVVVVGQQLKLIDLGSTCFCSSKRIHSNGTFIYSAPEAMDYDATYTTACDAFSLGATLYFLAYGTHMIPVCFNDWQEAYCWHARGGIQDIQWTRVASPSYMAAMRGLLHPDPRQRLTVEALYYNLCGQVVDVVDPDPITGAQGDYSWPERELAVEVIASCIRFGPCSGCPYTFALAVDILDRFAAAVRRPPLPAEILACATAGWSLASNDVDVEPLCRPKKAAAVVQALRLVLDTLRFRLYTNKTAYDVPTQQHRHPSVDFEELARATANHAAAADIVEAYLLRRDFVMLVD